MEWTELGPEFESIRAFLREVGRCGLREDSALCVPAAWRAGAGGGR